VASPSGSDALGRRRQLVGVLRVVVEPLGTVLYGEVVDPETGERAGFVGSANLPAAVETWVLRALKRSIGDESTSPITIEEGTSKD